MIQKISKINEKIKEGEELPEEALSKDEKSFLLGVAEQTLDDTIKLGKETENKEELGKKI